MRVGQLLVGRRAKAGSTALLSLATVAFVVIAATATGFPVSHVSANDGSVWLTDNALGVFGRFNDPIGQLDTVFGPPGAFQTSYNLDVLQNGTTVLAVDRNHNDLYAVNPQQGTVDTEGVPLPGGSAAQVGLGGPVAAVLNPSSGQVWAGIVGAGARASLTTLNTTGKPLATLPGGDAALAVGQDGTVYVASPTELLTIRYDGTALQSPEVTHLKGDLGPSLALTAVGTTPVLLDLTHRKATVPSTGVTIPIPTSDSTSPLVLQQAGPGAGSVLVASESSLYSLPLSGGTPVTVVTGGHGVPAQPVRLGPCVDAAWGGATGVYGRSCGAGTALRVDLPAITTPVFRVNNDDIVLNDVANGDAWSVKDIHVQALNAGDWMRLLESTRPDISPKSPRTGQTETLPQNQPPKAVDDHLEARAGRSSVLHVLDNDSDPAGSVLSIVNVSPASGPGYQVQISPDSQTLGITLDSGQSVPVDFQYTIVDGGGRTATATVTVTPTTSETPPYLRPGFVGQTHHVVSGGTASYQVLGDWRDHESDPLSVTDATVNQGTVTWTGDGLITYTAPVVPTDTPVTVSYYVSDGLASPVGGQLPLVVLGQGDTTMYPPVAEPDAYQVIVGNPTAAQPLLNDIPGADPLHPDAQLALAGPLSAPTGVTVATDTATGVVTITAQQAGIYPLSYQDSFGSAPVATGQILVDAHAASATAQPPVVVPTSVLLHGQLPSTVNVAASDYDPAGGVLTVVGTAAPTGIQATVVQGAYLRLVATTPTLAGQQLVDYQITNGTTQPVTGQVTVTWAPALPPSPPVAPVVNAVVRAGDEVDVPVLDKDTDPSGEPMQLLPGVVTVTPAGAGSASVAGGELRYAAPDPSSVTTSQQVSATYVVEDASGERTTGTVMITVNPVGQLDHPPAPQTVTARVTAGGTITVPIPTTGVDPDGDSVAVTGIVDPPQMGRILAMQQSSVTYQAYPYSAGTDSLTYLVTDPYGETGQATLRVAITPPAQTQPPLAVDDQVTAAPGSQVLVPILANDVIPPGDPVEIEPLSRTNSGVPAGTKIVGQELEVTAPSGAQPLVITYGITDGSATPSLAQVTVRSEPHYVVPPVAVDDYAKKPVPGQSTVTVKVLANDYDPGGSASDLKIATVFRAGVRIKGRSLVIPVLPNPQVVAYEIKNPPGGTSVGVVHVPGVASGPQVKNGLSPIQVPKNGSVTVDINKYITDPHGPVRLTSSSDVFVAPSNGLTWHPGSYTSLSLVGIASYIGPASLTIQVTDAKSQNDSKAKTALLSLPVQVGPAIPVIRCPTTPLNVIEGGGSRSLHLGSVCQVYTPNPATAATLAFSATWSSQPTGVSFSLEGSRHGLLAITAGSSAAPGATGAISVKVAGSTIPAKLPIQVIAAPLATVAPITIPGVLTGHTATVDLRQYVSSPFPSPRIEVLSVQENGGGNAQTTHTGGTVQITPQTGTHGIITFSVSVTDSPGRPERTVMGAITLQVLDVPGTPGALQGVSGNQQIALSWPASADNGSAVDYYEVSNGSQTKQVSGTAYTWTGLQNGTAYTFSVKAHNQVGASAGASTASFTPEAKPGAPTGVVATPGDGQVAISWGAAPGNGQALDSYLLSINPASGSASEETVSGTATSYTWTGLNNDVGPYTFTVTPHNALGSGPSASSSPVYAHGTPPAPGAPSATGAVSPDQTTTTVTVSFPAVSQCNDAQPCTSYTVTELKGGSVASTMSVGSTCAGAAGVCATFGEITNDGASYTYEVQAVNKEGQTSPVSAPSSPAIVAAGTPATVSNLSATREYEAIQLAFTVPASHGAALTEIRYTATASGGGISASGSWPSPGSSGASATETISNLSYDDTYAVSVEACNPTKCAAASNTATAVPYGPPNAPSVSASANGTSITFSWSGGGGNGQSVAQYYVCIDGSCAAKGEIPGSVTTNYGCGQSHSVYAYVVDDAPVPKQSANSSTSEATAAGCSVTVTEGGAASTTYCSGAGCNYVVVTMNNFAPNTGYTIWFSTNCQPSPPKTAAECQSGPDPGTTNYATYTVTTNASGYFYGNTRAFGYPGATMFVNVGAPYKSGGYPSNTITW